MTLVLLQRGVEFSCGLSACITIESWQNQLKPHELRCILFSTRRDNAIRKGARNVVISAVPAALPEWYDSVG